MCVFLGTSTEVNKSIIIIIAIASRISWLLRLCMRFPWIITCRALSDARRPETLLLRWNCHILVGVMAVDCFEPLSHSWKPQWSFLVNCETVIFLKVLTISVFFALVISAYVYLLSKPAYNNVGEICEFGMLKCAGELVLQSLIIAILVKLLIRCGGHNWPNYAWRLCSNLCSVSFLNVFWLIWGNHYANNNNTNRFPLIPQQPPFTYSDYLQE